MTHYTAISNKGCENRKSCLAWEGGKGLWNKACLVCVKFQANSCPPAALSALPLSSSAEKENTCLEGAREGREVVIGPCAQEPDN